MKKWRFVFASAVLILTTQNSVAADWQETNIQFLHGDSYKTPVGKEISQSVITLEHASSWAYGSNFFFIDISNPDTEDETSFYGEISPGFSLKKMGLLELSEESGPSDVLFQLNYEFPQGPAKRAALAGVNLVWKNLGFDFLSTQFLFRDTLGLDGHTGQLTLAWLKRFGSEAWPFEFSGFIDWAGAEATSHENIHMQPNLLLDFSRKTARKVPLKLGIEWKYWKNKYGIDGLEESVPQAKLVWIF